MTDDRETERDSELLTRALRREVARADRVELPQSASPRLVPLLQWSGWLAAGLLGAILWTDRAGHAEMPPAVSESHAVHASPETALVSTTAPSFTIGELPAMMLETRRAPEGGFEVLILRRTLERTHVSELVQLAQDEHGNSTDLPIPAGAIYATEGM